ncbi:hypothetical protein OG758_48535 [Streptomyces sp. NBC_01474]|nr:hypothetical protein [Streptomyces sp. NBC_01474]WSE01259.1 hypothetical protein OG758_48535 [Streptomyces sp. NBC_01474]
MPQRRRPYGPPGSGRAQASVQGSYADGHIAVPGAERTTDFD